MLLQGTALTGSKVYTPHNDRGVRYGEKLFVDGSSRVVEGQRKLGYAIVDGCTFQIKESGPLSKAWSAQVCEL